MTTPCEIGKYRFTKDDIGRLVFHRWSFRSDRPRDSQVGVILDVEVGVNGRVFVKFNHREFRSAMCHSDLVFVEQYS